MTRLVLLLSALAVASSLLPTTQLLVRARSVGAARTTATIMKKGRAQGGGPKIALKKKHRKTDAERAADKHAADIVRRAATMKRRPTVITSRQGERFSEYVGAGSSQYPVFARPTGDHDWVKVGHVALAPGEAELSAAEAAWLQKRCILEHAARLHPTLQQQKAILQCGLGPAVVPSSDSDSDKTAEGASAEEATEGANDDVELLVAPEQGVGGALAPAAAAAQATSCGFLGLPLPSGHYFGDSSAMAVQTDSSKVQLSKLGDDAKSAIAVQQTKTLGLRSLG